MADQKTVVYHQGKKYTGPDALQRALDGAEPDSELTVELDPNEPPRLVTTIHAVGHSLDEVAAMMELWGRKYPTAVVRGSEDGQGYEVWTRPSSE